MSIFPSHDQWHSLKIFDTVFLLCIAGECNGNVNIKGLKYNFFNLYWETKGHEAQTGHVQILWSAKRTAILIFLLQRQIAPKKTKKSMSIFRHVTSGFHWKIFATVFLWFIAGECHVIVNIFNYMLFNQGTRQKPENVCRSNGWTPEWTERNRLCSSIWKIHFGSES